MDPDSRASEVTGRASFLWDEALVGLYRSRPDDLRVRAFEAFGQNGARWVTRSHGGLDRFSEEARREWLRAAAEEFLVEASLEPSLWPHMTELLGEVHPFDKRGPRLRDLRGKRASVGVFPLDGSARGKDPAEGHVWHVEGLDQPFEVISSTLGARVGESHRLAMKLARKALSPDEGMVRATLARNWIITGEPRGGRVRRVELGNKLDLPTSRDWLFPWANHGDLPQVWPRRGTYRFANTVDDAMAVLRGGSISKQGERTLSSIGAKVLVSFVSEQVAPILAAVLLSPAQRVVLLATSDERKSIEPAKRLKEALLQLASGRFSAVDAIRIEERIPTDVPTLERHLIRRFHDIPERPLLLHLTAGNKLMFFAAAQAARMSHKVAMFYRDLDARPFEFTGLEWEGPSLVAGRLVSEDNHLFKYESLWKRGEFPSTADGIVRVLRLDRDTLT